MANTYSVSVKDNDGNLIHSDQFSSHIRDEVKHLAKICDLGERLSAKKQEDGFTLYTYENGTIRVLSRLGHPTDRQRRGF